MFVDDETVQFTGYASDDGENQTLTYSWESDVDGELSTSLSFSSDALTNGTHVITFSSVDEHGYASNTASITLTINGRPIPSITQYTAEADEGETITLAGDALDDNNDIQAWEWTSDIDGVVSTDQQATVVLSPGTHQISFRAMDGYGIWGEYAGDGENASVVITVNGVLPEVSIGFR